MPRLLVYRQTWRGRSQDGFVAACSVDDYDTDVIRKHEKTRKDKEDDRVRHLLTQSAHAEPVFLTYRAVGRDRRARRVRDGGDARVRLRGARRGPAHALDRPGDGRRVLRRVVRGGAAPLRGRRPPPLRVGVARPRRARGEAGGTLADDHPVNWFPAAIFPDKQLAILPYNRVVKDLGG